MLTNDRSLSAHHAPVSPVETRPEPYFRGTLRQAGRCRLVGGSESHGSARTRHGKKFPEYELVYGLSAAAERGGC
jgi:hypothetical protein